MDSIGGKRSGGQVSGVAGVVSKGRGYRWGGSRSDVMAGAPAREFMGGIPCSRRSCVPLQSSKLCPPLSFIPQHASPFPPASA
eukprot:1858378-Rhodomonas_salina.1